MRPFSNAGRAVAPAVGGSRLTVGVRSPAWKGWGLPLAILLLWSALSRHGAFPEYLLPHPLSVWHELALLWSRGELPAHILATAGRVAAGFLCGTAVATVLGALTGSSRVARELLDPSLQALKAVPSLAWVPLFILWFGIFETSKIILIAVGVFFPIYLNLMSGIRETDRKLFEVARVYRLSRWSVVRRVLLPATLPGYVIGLRAGLALGWMFVIAAELMGASQGLGFLMLDGQMTGNPARIIGALVLFALAGKLSDALLVALPRPLLAWQDSIGRTQ